MFGTIMYDCYLKICILNIAQALSIAGSSEWSVMITFTTAPSTPSPPTHLTMVRHALTTHTRHNSHTPHYSKPQDCLCVFS